MVRKRVARNVNVSAVLLRRWYHQWSKVVMHSFTSLELLRSETALESCFVFFPVICHVAFERPQVGRVNREFLALQISLSDQLSLCRVRGS